ncbi:hypothetical protein NDU88_004501 [Pleurodeles waltl]|uniref:Uncharacterized protein n=1 Tax=Pleurodeles waltl TaxID=8319 RepID=A0AAV7QIL8_PLEWA|nr:hypothetical protein NDU88_004501 [Pleurodeles waltl]
MVRTIAPGGRPAWGRQGPADGISHSRVAWGGGGAVVEAYPNLSRGQSGDNGGGRSAPPEDQQGGGRCPGAQAEVVGAPSEPLGAVRSLGRQQGAIRSDWQP